MSVRQIFRCYLSILTYLKGLGILMISILLSARFPNFFSTSLDTILSAQTNVGL